MTVTEMKFALWMRQAYDPVLSAVLRFYVDKIHTAEPKIISLNADATTTSSAIHTTETPDAHVSKIDI